MTRLIRLVVAVGVLLSACAPVADPGTVADVTEPAAAIETVTTTTPPTTFAPSPVPTTTTGREARALYIATTLERLSLESKIAQLIMAEFSGSDGAAALDLLNRYPLGGFLLKSANGNLTSSIQTRELTAGLQSASTVPLLLAVDQEGGRIDRVTFDDIIRFPSARVFGSLNDETLTERAAWATGVQLFSLGVNVDFAPVADVNVLGDANPAIGDRSYGTDPEAVAAMTVAALDGFRSSGVAAAVKHFPGHGNTRVDSHLGLPIVETDTATWERTDLVPFAAAVEAGTPMVMVAHVAFPALDATGMPASLSEPIVGGRLRRGLGFAGVVVTDDLANMAAVSGWGPGERAVRALVAGADLLLNPGNIESAIAAIVEEVESGRLPVAAIDAAAGRILGLKYDLGITDSFPAGALDEATRETVAVVLAEVAAACAAAALDCR